MTDNFIARSIIPKSDQLNAEDLISGSITVTVTDVKQGSDEQPVIVFIDGGYRPYKPCKTVLKILVHCWSNERENWIGKRLTLYTDPSVKWGKEAVGGIRISHLTGIDKEITLMLSETRGKRKAYTVQPLRDEAPQADPLDKYRKQFAAQSKPVQSLMARIGKVGSPDESLAIEADISAVEDGKAKKMLESFLADVLASLK